MNRRMTDELLAEIQARHRQAGERCAACPQPWPCDTRLVLDDLAALEWAVRRVAFRRLGTGRKSTTS